jgi:hypothetical protein
LFASALAQDSVTAVFIGTAVSFGLITPGKPSVERLAEFSG